MTRENYMLIADRIEQIKPLLKPEGITRSAIAKAIGVSARSAMNRIMGLTVESGAAFETFARVSKTMKTPEMIYFPTAADRDAFREAYERDKGARDKARQAKRSRESYERSTRGRLANERKEARLAARAEREAKAAKEAAEAAQRRAIAAAGREQAKMQARLEREAKDAATQRTKTETTKTQKRLKVETAKAGRLVFKRGTDVAKPKKPTFAELPATNPNGVVPTVIQHHRRGRFEPDLAPSIISSRECRPWAEAVAA